MEPAVERREHHYHTTANELEATLPQWSPPLNGGSTWVSAPSMYSCGSPQWSPPLNGGSTARKSEPSDLRKPVVARALRAWPGAGAARWTCQGAKRLLTCMRALLGFGLTTSALALRR